MSTQARHTRPRILIATPIAESKLYVFDEWVESIRRQDTDISFDIVVIDNTDFPSPGYLRWLREWAESRPLGEDHKVRLKRFGHDVDGEMFFAQVYKVGVAERRLWELFTRWRSYSHLLSLECDVLMPPSGIRLLYGSELPWAAGWMLSRVMPNPHKPNETRKIPLLWHSLDLQAWRTTKSWDELVGLGYMEPPSREPFPCVVTHLGCTLIDGRVIRSVPFTLTSAGGDVQYSWDVAVAGVQPYCVPAVACDHIAAEERPDHRPSYMEAIV